MSLEDFTHKRIGGENSLGRIVEIGVCAEDINKDLLVGEPETSPSFLKDLEKLAPKGAIGYKLIDFYGGKEVFDMTFRVRYVF